MRERMHPTAWKMTHRRNGKVIWEQDWTENTLADEGEEDMINVYFRNQTAPSSFYIGLLSAAPGETTTLATMTELAVSNGYARIALARNGTDWGAPALDSGDMQSQSVTKNFAASGGNWTGATHAFLTDVASGTSGNFILYVALSTTRTLLDGDDMDVAVAYKQA